MLGGFVIGWLSLETKTSCPDFGLSARAGVLALERGIHPSSISCAVLDARAGDWTLERGIGRLCGRLWVTLERGFERSSGDLLCRDAGRVHPALEREFGRSSGSLWVLLERGVERSSGATGFKFRVLTFQITFSLSLLSPTFPKTPLLSLSL